MKSTGRGNISLAAGLVQAKMGVCSLNQASPSSACLLFSKRFSQLLALSCFFNFGAVLLPLNDGPAGALYSAPAWAENNVKKNILESCPEALAEAERLNEDERRDLVSYLKLVRNLSQSAPAQAVAMPAFAPEPRVPGAVSAAGAPLAVLPADGLRAPNVWSSFEPNHQMEAKRCALEVAKVIAPVSLELLPELLEMVRDKTLPADFIDLVKETAFIIAARSASDWGATIPEDILAAVTETVGGEESLLAENILYELQQSSVPYLVKRLKDSDPKKCDAVCRALLSMDPQGGVIGPMLIDLMQNGSADMVVKVATTVGRLPEVYDQSLPVMLALLKTATGLERSALLTALDYVATSNLSLNQAQVTSQGLSDLLSGMQSENLRGRTILGRLMLRLLRGRTDLQLQLLPSLVGYDLDLRLRVLNMLAESQSVEMSPGGSNVPASPDAQAAQLTVLESILALFYDSALPLRLTAIASAGVFEKQAAQVVAAYLKLLKSAAIEKDAQLRTQIILAMAEGLNRLKAGVQASRLWPYLMEVLSQKQQLAYEVRLPFKAESLADQPVWGDKVEGAATQVLVSAGKETLPALYKLLKSTDTLQKRRALYVIGRIKPVQPAQVQAVISLLQDKDALVQGDAMQALSEMGQPAVADLRKALKSNDSKLKLAATQLLVAAGSKEKDSVAILTEASGKAECVNKPAIANSLLRAQELAGVSRMLPTDLLAGLVDCLLPDSAHAAEVIDLLALNAPLPVSVADGLLGVLRQPYISTDLAVKLIKRSNTLVADSDKLVQALIALLSSQRAEAVTYASLRVLGELGLKAAEAQTVLLSILEQNRSNVKLSNELVLALSRINPAAIDAQNYLLEQLKSDMSGEAQRLAVEMNLDLSLPVLMTAVNELSGHAKLISIQAIGDLPLDEPKAASLGVMNLLNAEVDSKIPEERYQATLALLKIAPASVKVEGALRRVLVSTLSQDLLLEELPKSVSPLIEAIVAHPRSRLETRNARAMLDKLR